MAKKTKETEGTYLVFVNYYNYNASLPVPFKILVAEEHHQALTRNYMVNPNNIKAITSSEITQQQKMIGMVSINHEGCTFYFSETGLGKKVTSGHEDWQKHACSYAVHYHQNMVSLTDILRAAGGVLVDNPNDCDLDLSSENLEKDTILNLLA